MQDVEIKVPDLGTTVDEVEIVRWLIEVGESIKAGQPLLEVETDKAVMEVESIATGTLKEVLVEAGEQVLAGQVIAVVDGKGGGTRPVSKPAAAKKASKAPPKASSASAQPKKLGPMFGRKKQSKQVRPSTPPPKTPGEYSRDFLLDLYERMYLIRTFEERVKLLFLEGAMPGTIHQCQGQEATAVGVCTALTNNDDYITSTHRPHGHALAKGLTPEEMLIELFGGGTGCCKGKGGSMHVGNIDKGMIPAIAIVGGAIPLAAGMGLAMKMQKQSGVIACFFGEGAANEGAFHEGINLASIWSLPVIFVCENNLYAASTPVAQVMRPENVADRASAYGIRGETIDGNDVLGVYHATLRAAEECRRGDGPVLLELLTYRLTGHSRRDPCHYQPDIEKEDWRARDPLEVFKKVLLERSDTNADDITAVEKGVIDQVEAAVKTAAEVPPPNPDDLGDYVLA